MKNILITGGAGFIGSRLCEKLFDKGYNITVLDNLSSQIHGKENSFLFNRIREKCTFIHGDVRNIEDWKICIKNQDIIVHLAAETGTGQSMYQKEKYIDVNINGTAKMLDLLSTSSHKIKKIVIASSRAVYGEGKYMCFNHGEIYPFKREELDLQSGKFNLKCNICNLDLELKATDEDSKIHPLSVYGLTKKKQEEMVISKANAMQISTVALRYQNVYGPGQSLSNPYTGIVSIFSNRILNQNNLDIYEDGLESRDFIYVDDAVKATILAIEKKEANGHVFNVGSGIARSVNDVAECLKYYYKSNIKIVITGKYRIGDIRHNYADLTKIKDILNFNPKYDFNHGISKFVEWAKNQEIIEDRYDESLKELNDNDLIK
jgi:dTDP-L-rhamnose 4-epimerase